jgi:hypothetical protein
VPGATVTNDVVVEEVAEVVMLVKLNTVTDEALMDDPTTA